MQNSSTAVSASEGPASHKSVEGQASRDTRVRDSLLLSGLVLLTRLLAVGPFEPDSALFLIGVRQWLRIGPEAIFLYAARSCPLYYATVAFLIRTFHVGPQHYALLMSGISIAAGVGIVVLGYLIGRRIVGERASAAAMVLFAISPGLWWITMEPHPQAISIFFGLLAVFLLMKFLEQSKWSLLAAAMLAYALSLGMKNDALLLAPVLLAAALWIKPGWRSAMAAFAVVVAGGIGFLILGRLIIGSSQRIVANGANAVATGFVLPNWKELVKQIGPDIFGIGIISAFALAIALFTVLSRSSERRRLVFLLLLWALPGYVFWLFIANNTRHVVAFGLPIFWIGGLVLQGRWLWTCVLLSAFVPPNSNPWIFPSPDVPHSARMTSAKLAQLDSIAKELGAGDSCFIGSYTDAYAIDALMLSGATIARTENNDVILRMPAGTEVRFTWIDPWLQQQVTLDGCRSVEYDRSGRKVRFLGDEWHIPAF